MDPVDVPAGSIVVGVDGSPESDEALGWAVSQALLENRPLTIVHATEPLRLPPTSMYAVSAGLDYGAMVEEIEVSSSEVLDAAAARARDADPDLVVHPILSRSDPRNALLELARHAAMVVVGSRGRGPVGSLLLGSVSVSVSKHAACPVVVRRPRDSAQPGKGILVGVDGTELSLPAVEFAFQLASERQLPLTVLHCYWDSTSGVALTTTADNPDLGQDTLLVSESLAGMGEKYPDVSVQTRMVRGFADRILARASTDYDLLVIGHHPVGHLSDLVYGSVAPAVVEHAHCAVAVVPALVSGS